MEDRIHLSPGTTDVGSEPIEPKLWQLTRAAVLAVGTAVDQYLEAGGSCPRIDQTSVGVFKSGWPQLQRPLVPRSGAPHNYSALIGQTRSQSQPIAYTDVPELGALISYVRSRDDLHSRVAIGNVLGKDRIKDQVFEIDVADLALSLLSQVRATGLTSEDSLLSLYLQRERAWLLDPLPVEYVVPLVLTAFDLDNALIIDPTTRIEPMNAATQAARAPSEWSITSVPSPVVGAATHALVRSGHEIPNPGPGSRRFGDERDPFSLDEVDLVCEALRIATDRDVGYAQVLRRPLGWADTWERDLPPLATVATLRRYPERFDDYGWLEAPSPIPNEALALVPGFVSSLREAGKGVRLAARRLSLAALRAGDDDRTIDACIGLEALLGQGRNELSHRLALRAATTLATRQSGRVDAQEVYKLAKAVYSHRSAVVHGDSGRTAKCLVVGGDSFEVSMAAVLLLRWVMAEALSRPDAVTPDALDATLLDSLTMHLQEK